MRWLWEGVASSLVAIVVALLAGNLIYWVTGRRKVKAFFHLGAGGIVIYTSRLNIPKGGSVGVDGQPRSYAGPAMPEYEIRAVNDIENFLGRLHPRLNLINGPLSFLQFQCYDFHVRVELGPLRRLADDKSCAAGRGGRHRFGAPRSAE